MQIYTRLTKTLTLLMTLYVFYFIYYVNKSKRNHNLIRFTLTALF